MVGLGQGCGPATGSSAGDVGGVANSRQPCQLGRHLREEETHGGLTLLQGSESYLAVYPRAEGSEGPLESMGEAAVGHAAVPLKPVLRPVAGSPGQRQQEQIMGGDVACWVARG